MPKNFETIAPQVGAFCLVLDRDEIAVRLGKIGHERPLENWIECNGVRSETNLEYPVTIVGKTEYRDLEEIQFLSEISARELASATLHAISYAFHSPWYQYGEFWKNWINMTPREIRVDVRGIMHPIRNAAGEFVERRCFVVLSHNSREQHGDGYWNAWGHLDPSYNTPHDEVTAEWLGPYYAIDQALTEMIAEFSTIASSK